MKISRRSLLKASFGLPATVALSSLATFTALPAVAASTQNQAAYKAKTIKDSLSALGAGDIVVSDAITINAADIAENGAVVPVAVSTTIPNAETIAILVEKNPNTLAADMSFAAGTTPYISTRVKMGQTSDVYAAVHANGKWHIAKKEIKVTLGGCGG